MNYKQGSVVEMQMAEQFMAKNQQLSTIEKLIEYGRIRHKSGRDTGLRKSAEDKHERYELVDKVFNVTIGGYVKHHNEVGIAIEETLNGWRVMLPSGLYTEVHEKDLTPISPQEFVEAVKPSKFVTNI